MKPVILYRGMNEEEYKCWIQSPEILYNVSWWTTDLLEAQLFADFAVAKFEIFLDKKKKVSFKTNVRGNDEVYRGWGKSDERYSISKDYIFHHILKQDFLLGEEILPSSYLSEEDLKVLGEVHGEFHVTFHKYSKKEKRKIAKKWHQVDKETAIEFSETHPVMKLVISSIQDKNEIDLQILDLVDD